MLYISSIDLIIESICIFSIAFCTLFFRFNLSIHSKFLSIMSNRNSLLTFFVVNYIFSTVDKAISNKVRSENQYGL